MREEIKQTLRRVGTKTRFEYAFRRYGLRRAAREEVFFIRGERGFNVARIRGDGLREFSAVEHGKVGPFTRGDHQVRRIA
jgi:hypothetical protein